MKNRKILCVLILLCSLFSLDTNSSKNVSAYSLPENTQQAGRWKKSSKPVEFPILMYHSFSSDKVLYTISANTFFKQMEYLKKENYYFLSPQQALKSLTENKVVSKKMVWVTIDDGYNNNYKIVKKLNDMNIKATIFDIAMTQGGKNFLNQSQIESVNKMKNISIQSHTLLHKKLKYLSPSNQKYELQNSRLFLNNELHQDTFAISYPYGIYSNTTIDIAKSSGYKIGVTTNPGLASKKNGLLSLNRANVDSHMSIQDFAHVLKTGKPKFYTLRKILHNIKHYFSNLFNNFILCINNLKYSFSLREKKY